MENKYKALKEMFSIGTPVFFKPKESCINFKKGSIYIGTVIDSIRDKKYPITVKFKKGNVTNFTLDGRYGTELPIELFVVEEELEKQAEQIVEGKPKLQIEYTPKGCTTINEIMKEITKEEKFEVGDKVNFSPTNNYCRFTGGHSYLGKITSTDGSEHYPIIIKFKHSIYVFTREGRISSNFPIELKIIEKHNIASQPVKIVEEDTNQKEYDHVAAPHYRQSPIETIDIFEKVYGAEKTADWCEITALKYRLRLGHKPTSPIEDDLKKEKWYLDKAIELREKLLK